MKLNNIKGLSIDVFLNILAAGVSTGVMQLILYPLLASRLGASEYGTMLTVMGIMNVIVLSLGNNLCNARIVQNEKYKKEGKVGDFQLLVISASILAGIIVLCSNLYFKLNVGLISGVAVAVVLMVSRSYYLVTYRLVINYKKNLIANVWMAIVYSIGAVLLIRFIEWPWIFALASLACLGYIAYSSDILKEPLTKTPLFAESKNTVLLLVISGLIGNITSYLDRFVLYPLLGSESVACYTTSAFFAKSISLVLIPITSVLLSYLVAGRFLMTRKRYTYINILLLFFCALFVLVSITFGEWITGVLYPTLIESAEPYVFLASIGVIIGLAGSFNGIVVLVHAPSYWQVILSVLKIALYLLFSILLVKKLGMNGLCISIIITNTLCFLINYFVGNNYIKKLNI